MSEYKCPLPIPHVDKQLAEEIRKKLGMPKSAKISATILRDLYTTSTGNELAIEKLVEDAIANNSDMDEFYKSEEYKKAFVEAVDVLSQHKAKINRDNRTAIKKVTEATVRAMDTFKENVSVTNQLDMVQHVIDCFFSKLTGLNQIGVDTATAINGKIEEDGRKRYGEAFIFERVFDEMLIELEVASKYLSFLGEKGVEGDNLNDQHKLLANNERELSFALMYVNKICTRLMDNVYKEMLRPDIKEDMTDREKLEHVVNMYRDMISNWPCVVMECRVRLSQTLGLKMSNTEDYGRQIEEGESSENDMQEIVVAEESERERWQEVQNGISMWDRCNKVVKDMLGRLEMMVRIGDDVETVRTLFGTPIRISAKRAYNELAENCFRYMQSEIEMMDRLKEYSKTHPTYLSLFQKMQIDTDFRSLVFISFYKGFQLYGLTTFEKIEEGRVKVKTSIANKKHRLVNLVSSLYIGMHIGRNAIINDNRFVVKENLKKLQQEIQFLFGKDEEIAMNNGIDLVSMFGLSEFLTEGNVDEQANAIDEAVKNHTYGQNNLENNKDGIYFRKANDTRKKSKLVKESLRNIFDSLGYSIDENVVDAILKDKDSFIKVRRILKDLAQYNFEQIINNLKRGSLSLDMFLKQNATSDAGDGTPTIKKLFDQLDIEVSKGIGVGKYEGIAAILGRHRKRVTVYSNVLPSFMNRFVNTIQNYSLSVIEDVSNYLNQSTTRLNGLREWITKNYLVSSQFSKKDAKGNPILIYNRLLRDLYSGTIDFGNGREGLNDFHISNTIRLIEDAGTKDMRVEDFGSRDLLLEMMSRFFGQMSTISHKKTVYFGDNTMTQEEMQSSIIDYCKEHTEECNNMIFVCNNTQYAFVIDHNVVKRVERPTADYSTFNLGDSGKINFITLRTYGTIEILGITSDMLLGENSDFSTFSSYFLKSEIYNLWLSELKRIDQALAISQKGNGNIKIQSYSENASKFSLLEYLNPIVERKAAEKGIDVKDTKAMHDIASGLSVEEVAEATYKYFRDSFNQFKTDLSNLGIGEDVYFRDEMQIYGLARGEKIETYEPTKEDFDALSYDYMLNHKFNQMLQMQIFDIDKSFYKNVKDLQKRHKQVHANGAFVNSSLDIGEGKRSKYRRVKYFDELTVNADELDQNFLEALIYNFATVSHKEEAKQYIKDHKDDLKSVLFTEEVKSFMIDKETGIDNYNMFLKYKSNKVTDGQAYISLEGYRRMHKLAKTWTAPMEQAYQAIVKYKMKVAENTATENDLIEIQNLAVIFQPIKPFTYTIEKRDDLVEADGQKDVVLIPVQHKCAEALIISELLPEGSKIRELAKYMEMNDLDMTCTNEVVKVGYWGGTKIDGVENLSQAMDEAVVHIIPFEDYRIQSNVPAHINQSRLFGTQLRKVLMGRIDMNKKYVGYFNPEQDIFINTGVSKKGKDMTGADVVRLYNSLITADILDSLEAFENIVLNNKKLSKRLQDSIMFNARNNKDALYAYALTHDERFTIPLFEGGVEHDTMAELLSIFRNHVTKQSMNGGSCVQAAPFDKDLECHYYSNYNVTYIDCVVPFAEKYTDAFGNEVALKWEDYCDKDGNLLMHDENISKIEHDFPGILDIIAYRIPTERAYSVMNLKVKRFSNPVMGGTIQVPSQFTTVAGFDFDVDKLFLLRKTLIEQQHTEEEWNKAYDESKKTTVPGTLSDKGERTVISVLNDAYNEHRPRTQKTDFGEILSAAFGHVVIEEENDEQQKYTIQDAWRDSGLDKVGFEFNGVMMTFKTFHQFQKMFLKKGGLRSYDYSKGVYEQVEEITIEETDDEKTKKRKEAQIERNKRIQHALRGNALIDLAKARLSDPETFLSRYSPGNFETMREAAHMVTAIENAPSYVMGNGKINMKKLYNIKDQEFEKQHDFTDPLAIVRINEQNQVAGKLIAMAANQNSNHIFAQLLSEFCLTVPIKMFGRDHQDMIHNGKEIANNVDRYVAEFLAASVDAVKDPVLNFLNLNPNTMNVAELMIRLGMTPLQMGLFLKQPIIMKVCKDIVENRVSIANAILNAKDIFRDEDSNTLKYLDDKLEKIMNSPDGNKFIDEEKLATSIANKSMGGQIDNMFQYAVLRMFESMHNISVELNTFVTSTRNTSSNAVRSTVGDMLSALERARQGHEYKYLQFSTKDFSGTDNLMSTGIIDPNIKWDDFSTITQNKMKYIEDHIDNPFAYEQAMFDSIQRMLFSLGKHFPYLTNRYRYMRKVLSSIMKYVPSGDMINKLHRAYPVFYVANIKGNNPFNGDSIIRVVENQKVKDITQREYYRYYFTTDLWNIMVKYADDPNIAILKNMIRIDTKEVEFKSSQDKVTKAFPFIRLSELALAVEDKNIITSRIEELYYHPEKEVRYIAIKLFLYGFYNKGFEYSDESFLSLIPTRIKKGIRFQGGLNNIGYTDMLYQLLDNESFYTLDSISQFITLFALNHLDEKSLAPTISYDTIGSGNDKKVTFNAMMEMDNFAPRVLVPNMKSIKTQRIIWESKNDKDEKELHCPPVLQVQREDGVVMVYVLSHNNVSSEEESGFVFEASMSKDIRYNYIGTKDQLEGLGINYNFYLNEQNEVDMRGDVIYKSLLEKENADNKDPNSVNEGNEYEVVNIDHNYDSYITSEDYKHMFLMMARQSGLSESEANEVWEINKENLKIYGDQVTDSYIEKLIKMYKSHKIACKDAEGNDTHLC